MIHATAQHTATLASAHSREELMGLASGANTTWYSGLRTPARLNVCASNPDRM